MMSVVYFAESAIYFATYWPEFGLHKTSDSFRDFLTDNHLTRTDVFLTIDKLVCQSVSNYRASSSN